MVLTASSLRKFSKSGSKPLPPAEPGSRARHSIPGPTSPARFFGLFMFSLLRKPMFVDPSVKAGIYICGAAAGSLIFDFLKMPPSYFSHKRNAFNLLFVKWGWAWTFCCLSTFILISTYVYTGGNRRLIRAHLMRLLFGSACWYACTGVFNTVEHSFGSCYNSNGTLFQSLPSFRPFNRRSCRQAKGHWLGFDISGHCFLLIMSNLWILEELRVMRSWNVLGALLDVSAHSDDLVSSTASAAVKTEAPRLPNVRPDTVQAMRSAYARLTLNLRSVFCVTACLSLLWDFMLLVTVVYFHSMPSKLLGASVGVSCWFVCYRGIFPSLPVGSVGGLAPGMPGDGPVHFVAKR
ncbi:Fat storage-inducing transmembrane protein [Taenia solium]|eukprot:TsM_000086900 transcript=TsM_000086900 gene=TsM_000086900